MDSKNFWMLPAVLPLALAIGSSAGAATPAGKAELRNTQLQKPKKAQYDVSVMDDGAPGVQASRTAAWLRGSKNLPIVPGHRAPGTRGSTGADSLERIDYSYITGTAAGGVDEIASDASFRPMISGDGAFTVFTSLAQNLTADDALGFAQIYRVDNSTGAMVMVSKGTSGPGNGASGIPTFKGVSVLGSSIFINGISNDGSRISFTSEADNLVAGDTNGVSDVFVWDSTGPTITRASVTSAGAQLTGASWDGYISGNGNFVVFTSLDAIGNTKTQTVDPEVALTTSLVGRQIGSNVFERDISGASTTLVSHAFGATTTCANSDSRHATVSDDGATVAFESRALNMVGAVPMADRGAPAFGNKAALTSIFYWRSGSGLVDMADREDSTGGTDDNLTDSWGPYISHNGQFVIYVSRKAIYASTGASRVICTDISSLTPWTTHRQMNTIAAGSGALPDAGFRFGWNSWISDDGTTAIFNNKPISADGFGDWDEILVKQTTSATTAASATDPFMISTTVGGTDTPDSGVYTWGNGNDRGQASRPYMSSDKTKFVFCQTASNLDGPTGGLTNVFLGTVDGSFNVTGMKRLSRGTTNGGTIAFGDESKEHESNFEKPQISPNGKYVVYVSRDPSPIEALPFASRPWNAGGYFTGVNDEQMYRVDTETGDWGLASFGVDFAGSGTIYPLGLGDPSIGIGNLYSFDDGSGYTVASGNFPIQDFAAEQNNEVAWFDLAYGFGSSHIYELGFAPSVSNNGDVAFWSPGYNDAPDGPLALSWAATDNYYLYVNNPSTGTSEAVLANGGDFIRNGFSHIVPFTEATHISADGRYVGFTSDGLDIVLPDLNAGTNRQAYIYDRVAQTNRLVGLRRDTTTGVGVTTDASAGESFLLGVSNDGQKALWCDVSAGNIFDPGFAPDSTGQLFLFNDLASGAASDGQGTIQCVSTDDTGAASADSSGTPFTGFYSGAAMSGDAGVVAFLGAIDSTTATGESSPAVGLQAYRKTIGANSGTGVLGSLELLSKASGAPFVDGTDNINTIELSNDGSQIVFPSDVSTGFSTDPATDANGAQWDVFRIASGSPGVVTIESIEPTNGQTDVGTSLPASVSQRGSTTRTLFISDADTVFNAGANSIKASLWLHTRSVAAADASSWSMYE